MNLTPISPPRPLLWPPLVEALAACASDPSRLYLVGGAVRDALRGYPAHDLDMVSPDNGLQIARRLADALEGAYYPVDPQRHTGRVLIGPPEERFTIDVASFRGPDLLADLTGRDFTINAMAVRLDQPHLLIDPLGGQKDLFNRKMLRQCGPNSIHDDPIRALRAVRMGLQFRLRIEPETLAAVRAAGPLLIAPDGTLRQPERARDELFKTLAGAQPAGALRLLITLGLWQMLTPFRSEPETDRRLSVASHLHDLLTIISPQRDDNTAADLTLGVAVMILDRYRHQLQEYLSQTFADGRPLTALLLLGAFAPAEIADPGSAWAERLHLSGIEAKTLTALHNTRHWLAGRQPLDNRQKHRYYRETGETGIAGVLLMLAEYLADQPPGEEPARWGELLEEVAAPLLDAFFRRHQQIVAPPPLLDGNDLIRELGLRPGRQIGKLLQRIAEEQAAGKVRTRKQALRLAERLASGKQN